jgi:hypothetical protein
LKRAAGNPVLGKVGRTRFSTTGHSTAQKITADTVMVDKMQTSHTSQSMAKTFRKRQFYEQPNPLFVSKPLSRTTIRKYSHCGSLIAPVVDKGCVNTKCKGSSYAYSYQAAPSSWYHWCLSHDLHQFLSSSPILINKDFSKPAVQQEWNSAGYYPHNVPRGLSRCSE